MILKPEQALMKPIAPYFLLISLMACGRCMPASGAATQLRSPCHPPGHAVLLRDVAQVHAADQKQAAELCRLELFPAPAVGSRRYVRLREVQDILERRGISLAEQIFSGASMVLITATETVEAAPTAQRQVSAGER